MNPPPGIYSYFELWRILEILSDIKFLSQRTCARKLKSGGRLVLKTDIRKEKTANATQRECNVTRNKLAIYCEISHFSKIGDVDFAFNSNILILVIRFKIL